MPSRRASLAIRLTTWKEAALSRPLVGSSRNSSAGRVRISMQMLTRRRWPPLIPLCIHPPMRVSAAPSSPISRSVSSALSRFAAADMPLGSCSDAE
ncbi:hypothetical protein CFC21_078030 [Triticum aestivum]|uniref:Uncharacterized protein n=2 Tax=Triticum aestivum TaxID=4565 RepID=A0A341W2G9_WHEAT|nr:hypothetical protein CFC21_078027 [Triticum aestivum]KAF7072968.1 hypothetical protein CFC21_078030 [Triticum aestivum]